MGAPCHCHHSTECSRANVSDVNGATCLLDPLLNQKAQLCGHFCPLYVDMYTLHKIIHLSFRRRMGWDRRTPNNIGCEVKYPRSCLPTLERQRRFSKSNIFVLLNGEAPPEHKLHQSRDFVRHRVISWVLGKFCWINEQVFLHAHRGEVSVWSGALYVSPSVCRSLLQSLSISTLQSDLQVLRQYSRFHCAGVLSAFLLSLPYSLTLTSPVQCSATKAPRTSSPRWNCRSKAATLHTSQKTAKRRSTNWKLLSRAQTPLFSLSRVRSRPSSGWR